MVQNDVCFGHGDSIKIRPSERLTQGETMTQGLCHPEVDKIAFSLRVGLCFPARKYLAPCHLLRYIEEAPAVGIFYTSKQRPQPLPKVDFTTGCAPGDLLCHFSL